MAFGDRFKKFYSKIDPFGGRIAGFDKEDRKKLAPREQFYGGSKEQEEQYRWDYEKGVGRGGDTAAEGLDEGTRAAQIASNTNTQIGSSMRSLQRNQAAQAGRDQEGFDQSVTDYRSGRGGLLQSADKLEALGDSAASDYMKTDQAQFQANQDAAGRQAMSVAASGGAGGLRTALATTADANLQGNQAAQITRANQFNDLLRLRQDATTNAANIRSGVASSDQALAGQFSNRQAGAVQQQSGLLTNQSNVATNAGQLELNAAQQKTNAGLTTQGQFLGAQTGMEAGSLAARQTAEAQRQQNEKKNYDNKWRPMKRIFGG